MNSTTNSTQSVQLAQSPVANRGVHGQRQYKTDIDTLAEGTIIPMIDYIRGVALVRDYNEFFDFIVGSTGGVVDVKIGKGKSFGAGSYFDNSAYSSCGAMFFFKDKGDFGLYKINFVISGKPCGLMGLEGCWRLIRGLLNAFKCGFTRIDLKVRASRDIINFNDVENAVGNRNYDTFRTLPQYAKSYSEDENGNILEHPTYYLGSKKHGDYFCRIYDPLPCHGVQNALDFESVFKDKKAHQIAEVLMSLPDGCDRSLIAQCVASLCCSQFDFKDRSSGQKPSRCPLLVWWENFLNLIETTPKALKITIGSKPKTFQKFLDFIDRQVISGLTALSLVFGTTYVTNMLKDKILCKKDTLSTSWLSLVETHKKHYGCELQVS